MKKFVTLIATLVVCFTFGAVALADTGSPYATDATSPSNEDDSDVYGDGNGTDDSSTSNKPSSPSTAPKTSDLLIVPGLATLAIGGTTAAVVSKKKMDSEK